jgi:hypothetical protein
MTIKHQWTSLAGRYRILEDGGTLRPEWDSGAGFKRMTGPHVTELIQQIVQLREGVLQLLAPDAGVSP